VCAGEQYRSCVVVVVVVGVMAAVVHSRCGCTHQFHGTGGHPAAPAATIHEVPLLRPQLLAASSVAAASADVDSLDPTRLAPQQRTILILDIDISFNNYGYSFHRVELGERVLGSLQELDELLVAVSADNRSQELQQNESVMNASRSPTLIQHPIAPTPVVAVALVEEQQLRVSLDVKVEVGSRIADQLLVRDLGKLVLRLSSTKFQLIFSGPKVSKRLLKTALKFNLLELAKLVVVVEPHRLSKNRCLDLGTVVAKVIKCASMVEFITFLFEICQNPLMKLHAAAPAARVQPEFLRINFNKFWLLHDSIRGHYSELFATYKGGCDEFSSFCQNVRTDHDNTSLEWYSDRFSKTHQVQTLSDAWNLRAKVGGLQAPVKWLNHAGARRSLAAQTVKLQVSLQPVVTGACSIAIGVRNVQVKVLKNAAHSDLLHTADHDNSYLSDLIFGLFVSHITVSVRPEVEGKQVEYMELGLASPNEPYDISAMQTTGLSTTFTGSKDAGCALTAAESSSTAIKLTTSDWHQEQTTQGADDEFTGTFCWNLRRLAGVPFNYLQPKCNKVINFRAFPIFKWSKRLLAGAATSISSSMLNLPFNSDGSVTFSEQFPSCKMMNWTLAHELAQKDVTWFVTVTVHLTMLNRFTGKGKTLEFRFCDHFKKKMMMMSTDAHVIQCTHTC
jgi:hypothetical protein